MSPSTQTTLAPTFLPQVAPPSTNYTLVEGIDTYAQAQEFYSSWAILIFISLLAITLFASYLLQLKKIRFLHETFVAMFLGMFVGLIIRIMDNDGIRGMVSFRFTVFFNLLLPPIILNSGYELEREYFFKNLGFILTFAFLGTALSAGIIGGLVYCLTLTGLGGVNLSLIECLMFGSILSSTDPVTVLAIFSQLRVDPKLYAIIFGESMLNDSVAIVLFETLQHAATKDVGVTTILSSLFDFFFVFVGSLVIGVATGLGCALVLKFTKLHAFPSLESCLVTLLAYGTYFFSNAVQMSGIVSLLFCSIILKHYAFTNLSRESQRTTQSMFRILAQLSENFCFIYLGITLFTGQKEDYNPLMIVSSLVIVCIGRYCSTIPIANLINAIIRRFYGVEGDAINQNYQLMLFWAGLRGAVAFALAMEIESPNASVIRSTILIVVVATVLVFGGTTPLVIRYLRIETGVLSQASPNPELGYPYESFSDDTLEEERGLSDPIHNNALENHLVHSNNVHQGDSSDHIEMDTKLPSLSLENGPEALFRTLDSQYLKPIFTRQKPSNSPLTTVSSNPANVLAASESHQLVFDDESFMNPFDIEDIDEPEDFSSQN